MAADSSFSLSSSSGSRQLSIDVGALQRDVARRRSVDSMAAFLEDHDWVELDTDLSHEELLSSLDRAREPFSFAESFRSFEFVSNGVRFSVSPTLSDEPLMDDDGVDRPTVFQFYMDLYGFGRSDVIASPGVLVCHLFEDPNDPSSASQKFELYSDDSVGDLEFFLESLQDDMTASLIYPGQFGFDYFHGEQVLGAKEKIQRTINAYVVDLDPETDEQGFPIPISGEAVETLFSRLPDVLMPSYVNLSGNGLHFYYVFPHPIQLFSASGKSPRRRKYRNNIHALFAFFRQATEGLGIKLDRQCETYCHGYRAPGSLTKAGDEVRCFCPSASVFNSHSADPIAISSWLHSSGSFGLLDRDVIEPDDVVQLTAHQIETNRLKREQERREYLDSSPASNKQLEYVSYLQEAGILSSDEVDTGDFMSKTRAGQLISKGRQRMNVVKAKRIPERPDWRTRPHALIAGSTGGVYQTILNRITDVEVGRRYSSLNMLAGVAYMMVDPVKLKEDVEADFMGLLHTPWADKGGSPITERDVNNALTGYCAENWRTKQSICDTLGFDPFGPSPKRNGNSREVHLAEVARPAYLLKSYEEKVEKIAEELRKNPSASKAAVSRATGISRPTVTKYWSFACALAGVEDSRSNNFSPS